MNDSPPVWRWYPLSELTAAELHAVLALRCRVFVVEQDCAYQDVDDLDLGALHLCAWTDAGELLAYLRLLPADSSPDDQVAIGRVVVAPAARGRGLARQAMERGIRQAERRYPGQVIEVNAQAHLSDFYRSLDFQPVGAPFLEDGIPHVRMLRPAAAAGHRPV